MMCGAVMVVPAAVFFEALYEACLAAHTEAFTAVPGRYPLIRRRQLVTADGGDLALVAAAAAAPQLTTAAALAAATVHAQAFVALVLVAWLSSLSAQFVIRSHGVWSAAGSPLRNGVWVVAAMAAIAAQVAYSHVWCASVGAPSPLVQWRWEVWVASAGWLVVSVALASAVKRADARAFEYRMKALRARFDTRLGMYSPR